MTEYSSGPDDRTQRRDGENSISDSFASHHPSQVGPYRILRPIGQGGMGTVYEAIQEEPRRPVALKVTRPEAVQLSVRSQGTVALKVMRAGTLSEGTLRRFRFEAQLLARLQHPGIAQVYETGTWTDGGQETPFIAMEYITGAKPVTEYVREKHLSLRERLELFVQICDAVHHGHQKGIVHRDLKPGNILCDGSGRVRIIDFGVARATDSDLVGATHQTMAGQLVGSLPYMSPEQFEADPHNIDTRSDVYSLGVVLYELLSGRHPHEMATSQIHELARLVCETSPRKISDIDPALRGEVEAIVHKALERDRDARYQSAFGVGQDIRRYLNGEAISARPQTLRYQVEVFARRHRVVLMASVLLVLVLASGTITSTTLYLHGKRAQATSERESERAQAALQFLESMLVSAVPNDFGEEPTVHDMLDHASEELDEVLRDDPDMQVRLRATLARAYFALAQMDKSARQYLSAYRLASNRFGSGDPLSMEVGGEALWLCTAVGMGEEALAIAREREALERERRGALDPVTLEARYDLAGALEGIGSFEKAEEELRDLIPDIQNQLGPSDPLAIGARASLGQVLLKLRRDTESLDVARSAFEDAEGFLPENHQMIRWAKSVYGAALIIAERFDDAEHLYGRPVPKAIGFDVVFQGKPDLDKGGLQLVVFWETWCPYSRRAVPALEPIFETHRSSGLEVVGLTRMTRNSTPEKVREFIRDEGINFAVAKDDGRAWTWFEAQGTPWLSIVRDHRVIWEYSMDSPEQIPRRMIAALARSQ